jgi:uncharacterized caspase-like protein
MATFRKQTRVIVAVALSLALGTRVSGQVGGPRYALVIGNADYAYFGKLANPTSDATDIAAALEGLGFSVRLLTDASRKQMNQSLNDFRDQLASDSSSAGFFWYAGHGIQSKGENYLLPVGASINREADLEDEAVSTHKIMSLLDDARNRVNVVVLDACRNNPIPSMGRSGMRGLTVVSSAPAESIIMYSTGAGQVAQDGDGKRNSPFAQAFLKYIAQGGDITATIKAVTAETKRLTNGAQIPYLYSSLTQDFALNSKPRAAVASTTGNSEPPKEPTVTIARDYGSIEARALTAGELYLDDVKMADLAEGTKATLNNIEVGARSLEMRYKDGKTERQEVLISLGKITIVAFRYQKTLPPGSIAPSLTLNYNGYSTQIGQEPANTPESLQLIATASPPNEGQMLTWTSSNPRIATVSATGLVKCISVGTVVITATSSGQKTTAACAIAIWQIGSDGFLRYFCDDPMCYGHWFIRGLASSSDTRDLTATKVSPITVQVKKVSGSIGEGFGIVFFEHEANQKAISFYRFMISANGQYRFQKCVDGEITNLVRWSTSSAIICGYDKVNTLSVWQPDVGKISASINGTTVVDALPDASFSDGLLLCYASSASATSSIPDNYPGTPEDIRYKVISPFSYPSVSND